MGVDPEPPETAVSGRSQRRRRGGRGATLHTGTRLGISMSNQVEQLLAAGQSVWLDNLRRGMFASGELQGLIDKGLRGMTSNPTIFEKAIGSGNDYDEQLRSLIGTQHDASALFWDLAVADICSACDLFRPVYDSSGGNDGFVSIEVSPLIAHDTKATVAMAKELWKRI